MANGPGCTGRLSTVSPEVDEELLALTFPLPRPGQPRGREKGELRENANVKGRYKRLERG